jgi:SSS family solute:Na+ symporter
MTRGGEETQVSANYLDSGIIVGTFAGMLIYAVFYSSGKIKSDSEFYLGKRDTPWWAIGISVAATYFSAIGFLGGPAWSYAEGLSTIALSLNYPLVLIVVAVIFLPFFYNSGCASIYEYQERRFGASARALMAFIFLLTLVIYSGAVVFAAASVVEFLTGFATIYSIVFVTIAVFAYTVVGGTTAVIRTDVVQAVIFTAGTLIILVGLLLHSGDRVPATPDGMNPVLDYLRAQGRTQILDTTTDSSAVATIWTGVIGMGIYHVVVYGVNQMIVQRALAAKSLVEAKKSYLLVGYLMGPFSVLFPIIGVLLYAYYGGREFKQPNTIILEYARDSGFHGLVGLTTVAVMAAGMSTMSSAVNSMSTISTVDFYQRFLRPSEPPEHYLKVARLSTAVWALLIIFPAYLYSRSSGSILEVLSEFGAYFVGAKLGMYFLGFYSKHTNERGLFAGVAAGFVVLYLVTNYTDIAWPWYSLIGGAVTIPVAWIASILLGGFQREWSPHTVRGQQAAFKQQGRPEKVDGWYVVPGRIDRASYWLIAYFFLTLAVCFTVDWWIR